MADPKKAIIKDLINKIDIQVKNGLCYFQGDLNYNRANLLMPNMIKRKANDFTNAQFGHSKFIKSTLPPTPICPTDCTEDDMYPATPDRNGWIQKW